jgi:hypothetical protein
MRVNELLEQLNKMTIMRKFTPPTAFDIKDIAMQYGGENEYVVKRFNTGLCHYVFDVSSAKNRFVVRVCHPLNKAYLEGYLFWENELKGYDLPIAKILADNMDKGYYYLILERLNGVDLGCIYEELSTDEKLDIVKQLVKFQNIADLLPEGSGFGWGTHYQCSNLKSSWLEIIESSLVRAREWVTEVGKVDLKYISKVESLKDGFQEYFKTIRPKAYFHDLTTKNLLISEDSHRVVGFVDVDEMGFGDKYYHISLMNMALLAGGHNPDLVDMWLSELSSSEIQRRVITFYTLIHCVTFMGENGKAFNGEAIFSEDYQSRLDHIFSRLLLDLG